MKITFVSLTLLTVLSVSCGEKAAPVLAPSSDSGLSADVGGDNSANGAPPVLNGAGGPSMPGSAPMPGSVPMPDQGVAFNDPASSAVVDPSQATTPGTDPGAFGEGSLGGGDDSAGLGGLGGDTLGGDSLGSGGGLGGDGSLSGLGGFGGGDSGGGMGGGMGGFGDFGGMLKGGVA